MSNKSFQDDGYEKYSKMLPEKMNLNEVGGALARMTMYREAYERLRTDLAAARAEIERLNGRRCDTCKHGTPYYGPDQMKVKSAIWCTVNSGMDERVSKRFEFGEHYCKSWEKR